jgi:hypothetical protein
VYSLEKEEDLNGRKLSIPDGAQDMLVFAWTRSELRESRIQCGPKTGKSQKREVDEEGGKLREKLTVSNKAIENQAILYLLNTSACEKNPEGSPVSGEEGSDRGGSPGGGGAKGGGGNGRGEPGLGDSGFMLVWARD